MQSDPGTSVVILQILGALFVVFFILFIRNRIQRSRVAATPEISGVKKDERIYESKEDAPKLPRNETLYGILKNGSLSANQITFDPFYIFDEIAAILRKDIYNRDIELLFDVDQRLPSQLIGSPKRLSRILINLLENALQFSEGGIVILKVNVDVLEKDGCTLTFDLTDEGCGMSPEELDALQVDPEIRVQQGKTPYGYYVANALVASEGGAMRIESAPSKGTQIVFTLAFDRPAGKEVMVRRPSDQCRSLNVAVVARHHLTAKLMENIVSSYVNTVETYSGSQTIGDTSALVQNDIVIIDAMLSDGALSHALKSNGCLLVTMQSILDSVSSERHSAADYQLSIPFTPWHVIEMLIVFFGEEMVSEAAAQTEKNANVFDHFVSDAQIPVANNISKGDFASFMGAKLLIVEDNPINQRVIKGLLGDSGMLIHFAENGVEALEMIEQESPFDLVLMDINMPVMDGFETTTRIRGERQYDDMPVVAFTGLNLQDQIEKMQAAGMNAHMAKPLNIGRIYSVFDHFLPKSA